MQTLASSRAPAALSSRAARRSCARRAEQLRARILGVPQRPGAGFAKCSAQRMVSSLFFNGYSLYSRLLFTGPVWASVALDHSVREACSEASAP